MLGLALVLTAGCGAAPEDEAEGARIRFAAHDAGDFERVVAAREFTLPQDHGPHYGYQTEWWYYTGNLETRDGRRFGYQLTFFRRGLSPGPPSGAGLQTNQVYLAHFAVSDVASHRHVSAERWSRGADELAGATGEPFRVWLEDWHVRALDTTGSTIALRAKHDDMAIGLEMRAGKPLVAHGERGLSQKRDAPGNASYYVGYTRLATEGTLRVAGEEFEVVGSSWFDHEWSTSALGAGAVGWDWFSLQLNDGREIMLFQIRREDGGIEPVSSGTIVAVDGTTRRLAAEDFELLPLRRWSSPATSGAYPVEWRLRIPADDLELELSAAIDDQEMRTAFVYWEGAVDVEGSVGDPPLRGRGYLEMTGYASSMQGVF